MSYQKHNGIPPYDFIKLDARGMPMRRGDGLLIWGRKDGLFPPAIGARINVRINACGLAVVTGYFSQDGYLGLLCKLEDAPAWHRKQNNNDPTGHVFGPEFELLPAGMPASAPTAAPKTAFTVGRWSFRPVAQTEHGRRTGETSWDVYRKRERGFPQASIEQNGPVWLAHVGTRSRAFLAFGDARDHVLKLLEGRA